MAFGYSTGDSNSFANSGAYSAEDAPDQNLTASVQISGQVNHQNVGDNNLVLSVTDDYGRTTSTNLTVRVEDQTSPAFSFTTGSKTIDWLVGTPFQVPTGFVTANDNLDGNITGSIIFGNLDLIDENKEGNQTVSLAVSDAAGNMAADSLTVSFQTPTFSLNGVAIDGYLTGASLFSDRQIHRYPIISSMEQRIQREVLKLDFLANEFDLVDTNGNGLIDREEGMIEVSGGVDTVTNRVFEGTLKADGGAGVVTPLTTVIAEMINQGTNKETAISLMSDAFGLPTGLDITNYDPIKNASEGSSDLTLVLQSGAVVANISNRLNSWRNHQALMFPPTMYLTVAQEIGVFA